MAERGGSASEISRGEVGSDHVEEEDLLLALEDAEEPAAGQDLPAARQADVVGLVAGCARLRQRTVATTLP